MRKAIMAFMALALISLSYASPMPSNTSNALVAYLNIYIPNSVIYNSTYINQSIGSSNYSIMLLKNGSFIVTNVTNGQYSLVINANTASYALAPYLFYKDYPNSTILNSLTTLAKSFRQTAQANLNDCLTETGLGRFLCTPTTSLTTCLQNSCYTVPVCGQVVQQGSMCGAEALEGGLLNFSYAYIKLNQSYNEYLNIANSINKTNVGTSIPQLATLATQLSAAATLITAQNPIYPLPASLAGLAATTCTGGCGNQWYCFAVGFCKTIAFNTTALSSLESEIAAIEALPLTDTGLHTVGSASAAVAYSYYWPVEQKVQAAALSRFLNSTASAYNSLEGNMSFIASRYSNASLALALTRLVAVHDSIISKGGAQNFTNASVALSAAIANASISYKKYGSPYITLYNKAFNNTKELTVAQLDYSPVPYQISFLATQEGAVNARLAGSINSSTLAVLTPIVANISSQAASATSSLSLGTITKALYGGMINALSYSPTAAADPSNASAPAYVAIIAFVEGIVVLGALYFLTYYSLNKRNRIQKHAGTGKAWAILFGLLFVLVLIYTYSAYAVAASANSFLPVSSFVSALGSSSKVFILTNSSIAANPSVAQCTDAIKSTLTAESKTVINTTYIGNYSCTVNASVNGPGCFGGMLSSGHPVIVMTGLSGTSISYHGLYGTALFASGSSVLTGPSCELLSILKS